MTEPLKSITVIGASAGTGKTYRLASEFTACLRALGSSCPTEIIATTFTNRAADELTHRIRKSLLRDDQWSKAQALIAASIGTVNSICGRLVGNLAIDAGLSPSVRIIAEEHQKEVFHMAVEQVTSAYVADLWHVIYRLGKEDDWRNDVAAIADIARQNNISAESLTMCGIKSWQSWDALLPPSIEDNSSYYGMLKNEIDKALLSMPASGDDTKMTVEQKKILQNILHTWESMDELSWHAVVKLSKLKPGKRSELAVQGLRKVASEHTVLPVFREDMKALIHKTFCCAADCLRIYQEFKAERGLLDFIDQEQIAVSLLRQPEMRHALKGKFSRLFVDEFQDTSPIQLAVFLELARIVVDSIWVGDQKQSIFGFRGADPSLMQAVVNRIVPETGGSRDNLSTSYRSRPSLVDFVNSIFVRALTPLGLEPSAIEIRSTARKDDAQLNTAVHVWWLAGSNQAVSTLSLAHGVLNVLLKPQDWIICNGTGQSPRPIRGSDIAVLCRSNEHRIQIADALSNLGIIVSTERSGLLQTPECILAAAVLRYLADSYDTLAMAEIVRYTDTSDNYQRWFQEWLEVGYGGMRSNSPILRELDQLRNQLIGLTPVECVQLVTTTPAVLEAVLKWGDHRQRLLNFEALLGVASQYEEYCATDRSAATVAGLVTFLKAKCNDAVQPANPDDNAVNVITYHKSKGLEWPMVVMCDLDAPPPATPFGVHVPKQHANFDVHDPLVGRTIRYWPWPYGQQKRDVELANRVLTSPEMVEASTQRKAESLRLLYVGMTRARDYLILACRNATSGAEWLHMATDSQGESLFQLNDANRGNHSIVKDSPHLVALYTEVSVPGDSDMMKLEFKHQRYTFVSRTNTQPTELSYSCAASGLRLAKKDDEVPVSISRTINLGPRLNFSCAADMKSLGDALHHFLAVDDLVLSLNDRLSIAKRIAESFQVSALIPEQFVEASTRLRDTLDELYPDATWLTEWPVAGRYGTQRIQGAIDLLLELSEGYVVIDHKSFPGGTETWEERAISHYPQLDAYANLVEQATSKPVIASFIHMPVLGLMVGFSATGKWTAEQSAHTEEESWMIL